MSVDWSSFIYVCDPGVGQDITTLHPAFTVTFHFQRPDIAGMGQLYAAALELIGPELTHYQAENMKRPSQLTARATGMIPTWLQRPRSMHAYWWEGYGGSDLGCSPPGFDFWVFIINQSEEQQKMALANALHTLKGPGEVRGWVSSTVRIVLPVDHHLSEGAALRSWLGELIVVQSGSYSFIECGYGLASKAGPYGGETERLERAFCSRYPGFDCFRISHTKEMFRADPDYPDFVPLVKRAAWTTLLHPLTVRYLGGERSVREGLHTSDEIIVQSLPQQGLLIQAGDRPRLGDLSRGDFLPLQREVARVLAPARTRKPAETNEFWNHFFNMFEKDYT